MNSFTPFLARTIHRQTKKKKLFFNVVDPLSLYLSPSTLSPIHSPILPSTLSPVLSLIIVSSPSIVDVLIVKSLLLATLVGCWGCRGWLMAGLLRWVCGFGGSLVFFFVVEAFRLCFDWGICVFGGGSGVFLDGRWVCVVKEKVGLCLVVVVVLLWRRTWYWDGEEKKNKKI